MTDYRVTWEIEIEANSPREAALAAQRIQRDRESIASVFIVQERFDDSPHGAFWKWRLGNRVVVDLECDEASDKAGRDEG